MLELLVLFGLFSLLAFLCFCVLCKGVGAILILMWEILRAIVSLLGKGIGFVLTCVGQLFLLLGALLGISTFRKKHQTRRADSDEDFLVMRGQFIRRNRLTRRVEALEEILLHR